MAIPFHELANIFPLIEGNAFDELVDDIKANGLTDRIILHEDKILDGRNRYNALVRLGYDDETIEVNYCDRFDDIVFAAELSGQPVPTPLSYVISKNLTRRHLDASQRAMIAARIATLPHGSNQWTGQLAAPPTQADAAVTMNVGERSVRRAREVIEHGSEELQRAVDRGDVSVSAAAKVAKLPIPQQLELLESCDKQVILKAAKDIYTARTRERHEQNNILAASTSLPVPEGKFETIVIDPPWPATPFGYLGVRPENKPYLEYPTMNEAELIKFGETVGEIAADNCHLFCWTVHKFLPVACQSAPKFDPRSASNFDPLVRRVRAVALAPSELVGVAETARARVVGRSSARLLKRQLSFPVSMMSQ